MINSENEVNRYFYTAKVIAHGIYGQLFFNVLPYLPAKGDIAKKIVYFPRTSKPISSSDWEKLKNEAYKFDKPLSFLSSYENVVDDLKPISNVSEESTKKIRAEWEENGDKFFKIMRDTFEIDFSSIRTVNILPTTFGSSGTYNLLNNKDEINIHLRIDQDVSVIPKLLFSAVVRKLYLPITSEIRNHYAKNSDWLITESVSDFFFKFTTINKLLPRFVPTLSSVNIEKDTVVYAESKKYLNELGFSLDPSIYYESDIVYKENGIPLKSLTNQEKDVLVLLMSKNGNLVVYEEIAQKMWGDLYLDKFSLYAINKVVFQIRQKLKINNILSARIMTVRGKGYILYC